MRKAGKAIRSNIVSAVVACCLTRKCACFWGHFLKSYAVMAGTSCSLMSGEWVDQSPEQAARV